MDVKLSDPYLTSGVSAAPSTDSLRCMEYQLIEDHRLVIIPVFNTDKERDIGFQIISRKIYFLQVMVCGFIQDGIQSYV